MTDRCSSILDNNVVEEVMDNNVAEEVAMDSNVGEEVNQEDKVDEEDISNILIGNHSNRWVLSP